MSGTAERSLVKNANGTWDLNFKASMMIASLTEQSTLRMENDTLLPQKYHFERGGLGKAKKVDLNFDWTGKKVTGSDRGDAVSLPLNRGVLDKSSYQLALQHDVAAGKKSMTYQVVDGDEIDTYDFRVLGTEKVTTKTGQVDAVKVERVRDPSQSKRITELQKAVEANLSWPISRLGPTSVQVRPPELCKATRGGESSHPRRRASAAIADGN